MKNKKNIFRNIIIFFVAMGISILPTLLFRTEDEANFLFRQPEYWVMSAIIAAIGTLIAIQAINISKK